MPPLALPRILACTLASLALAGSVSAQSGSAGEIRGIVQDSAGAPLFDVVVTAMQPPAGRATTAYTARDGSFRIALLGPGKHEVRVERVGFRPLVLTGVPVRAGRSTEVAATLAMAPPPVTQIERREYRATAAVDLEVTGVQVLSAAELDRYPSRNRDLRDLGRLSLNGDRELDSEGLPARASRLWIDGMPLVGLGSHLRLTDSRAMVPVPSSAVGTVELGTSALDVEAQSSGAETWKVQTRPGTAEWKVTSFGSWGRSALGGGDTKPSLRSGVGGGVLVSGPLLSDSASIVVGLEGWSDRGPNALSLGSGMDRVRQIAGLARDSFEVDLGPVADSERSASGTLSSFGRVDWLLSAHHVFTSRLVFAQATRLPSSALFPTSGGRIRAEGSDLLSVTSVTSSLGRHVTNEIRIGFQRSTREAGWPRLDPSGHGDARATPSQTSIADSDLSFGILPGAQHAAELASVRLVEAVRVQAGDHGLKLGLDLWRTSYSAGGSQPSISYFQFGDAASFARGDGAAMRISSLAGSRTLSLPRVALFAQDTWRAAPGLELLVGVRGEVEAQPAELRAAHDGWASLTGTVPVIPASASVKPSPRAGFRWDVGARGMLVLRGNTSLSHDPLDFELLTEIATHMRGTRVQRWAGSLPQWPVTPDSITATSRANLLSVAPGGVRSPRTARSELGVSFALPNGGAVHLSGTYRRTDRLARRFDLNRPSAALLKDQHGRPMFGIPIQRGTLLTAQPGSGRRFDDFDIVSAYTFDGASTYRGFDVAVEQTAADWLRIAAGYSYSSTQDNWLIGSDGPFSMPLVPILDEPVVGQWAQGTSNFDVPHRMTLRGELRLPALANLSLGAVVSHRSGRPFTPAFQPGVDANADGSAGNDPAFVDPSIPGVAELASRWECLRGQAGIARRNSCRTAPSTLLDLRASIPLPGRIGTLYADVYNLLNGRDAIPDQALYLFDSGQPLRFDPARRVVTLPLRANPNFGQPTVPLLSRREFRVGMRVDY